MERSRGFTLMEVLVAAGILALVAAGAAGVAMSARATALQIAVLQFDALLDAALTTAHELDGGVTIAVTSDRFGDGFVARAYRNRPGSGRLVATTIPAAEGRASLEETAALGPPPFALVFHGSGLVAGIRGDVVAAGTVDESPCPAQGAYHLVFAFGGARVDRYVACRTPLAATTPAGYVTPIPATPAPRPTANACLGGCAIATPAPASAGAIISLYFEGPTRVQVTSASPGSGTQPCDVLPAWVTHNETSGDASSGGWYEDDWYFESRTLTVAAFRGQYFVLSPPGDSSSATLPRCDPRDPAPCTVPVFATPAPAPQWRFTNPAIRGSGSYLDPTLSDFRATGSYGATATIPSSTIALDTLAAADAALPLVERDFIHESCFATWSTQAGGP
ncbi:MAG: prepilin-type N-terminal cleavage/methylation domain-containing protein [Candidatus Eremiobacteraeota bacterium]|nr:prepilin-type N-terminal cleavage/methylation domain-containing protein [Candidatus Eremiobacteraeota bacterium]